MHAVRACLNFTVFVYSTNDGGVGRGVGWMECQRKFEQFLKYRTTYSPRSLNISANWRSPWQSRAEQFRFGLSGGAYMIPGEFTRSHFTGITRSYMWAFVRTSHFGALLPIDTHALLVPVHDTAGTECGQISCRTNLSYQYENRTELVAPYDLYRCDDFVAVSCKWIQSYEWAPWWTQWWNLNKQNAIGPAEFSSFFKS